MFRKLSTFRGDSALSTWLHRIAVNTVLLHFRKKALTQVSLDDISNQDSSRQDSTPRTWNMAAETTGSPPRWNASR